MIYDKKTYNKFSFAVIGIAGLLALITQSIMVAVVIALPPLLVIKIIYYYSGHDYSARAMRDQNRADVWSRNLFSFRKSGTCFTCNGTGIFRKICRNCNGSGIYRPKCNRCDGSGRVQHGEQGAENKAMVRDCSKCSGTGLAKLPCKRCAQTGGTTVTCFKCGGSGIHYF